MKPRLLSLTLQLLAMYIALSSLFAFATAQGPASVETSGMGVILTKLYPLVYPPIARTARVTGDVKIEVRVRRDGIVSSAEVVSGHPLLKDAALKSAQYSTFECRGCEQELTSYSLTYTFGLREDIDCGVKRVRSTRCLYLWRCGYGQDKTLPRASEVRRSQDHITFLVDSVCIETQSATSSGS